MKKNIEIFDNPKNVNRLLKVFFTILILVLIAEFFVDMHGEFYVEHFFGFYAVFGFCAYVLLIFSAKILRKVLMRKEDYYDN